MHGALAAAFAAVGCCAIVPAVAAAGVSLVAFGAALAAVVAAAVLVVACRVPGAAPSRPAR